MEHNNRMNPFRRYLGLKDFKSRDGVFEVRIDIFPDLLNFSGNVHGGVIASLVDMSIGNAVHPVLNKDQYSTTVELKINYLKPLNGKTITAKSCLLHKGKTLLVGKADIFNEHDQLVATGTATFMILNKYNKKL
ncbi:PaaI family thioesterase (plasmid) [Priestia megaterium]|uniref:PaaI family thioesterase n=1 Tax=Priestia megaterium TaxID=1404 RepID=UPI000BF884C0|nr:PaaI family thioesterase [Priestia megaterium]MDH2449703.1 PaaI family thioesterase [Priestia megaterium]MDL5149161.1 PaaI family thioesterase [Priestia megaterium]PER65273.1 thioesterase [Priestia megaterium]